MDIESKFFKKVSPKFWEFLVSEEVNTPSMPPPETNNQVNQRLMLLINVTGEAEKKTITIKKDLQPMNGI